MTADLSAAIAALTAELDDRPGGYDTVVPLLSHLTLGHLRALAAALAAPHVPGQRVVTYEEFATAVGANDDDEPASAHLFIWDPRGYSVGSGTHHYFLAVQS